MIKETLQSITNVEILAIISLVIILSLFVMVLVYTFRIKKDDLNRYSRMPLDETDKLDMVRIPIDNKKGAVGE